MGERSGQVIRLGDHLVVSVAKVNLEDKKIDFDLVSAERKPRKTTARLNKDKSAGVQGDSDRADSNKKNNSKKKTASNKRDADGNRLRHSKKKLNKKAKKKIAEKKKKAKGKKKEKIDKSLWQKITHITSMVYTRFKRS